MMGPLHTVNKSPGMSNTLYECLAHLGEGAALLLIEDGVYAALARGPAATALEKALAAGHRLYVLKADIEARGLERLPLIEKIAIVDHAGFVALAAAHRNFQAWL